MKSHKGCETCARMRYKGLERGGFAPQCRIIFGEATEPERAAVEKWIDARSKFSNFEGPNPGSCPLHMEGEPKRTPHASAEVAPVSYLVGWSDLSFREEVESRSPKEAAEKWIASYASSEDPLPPRTAAIPVVVIAPDGAQKKFTLSARVAWTAEEVTDAS